MPKSRQRRNTGGHGGVSIPGHNPWASSDDEDHAYYHAGGGGGGGGGESNTLPHTSPHTTRRSSNTQESPHLARRAGKGTGGGKGRGQRPVATSRSGTSSSKGRDRAGSSGGGGWTRVGGRSGGDHGGGTQRSQRRTAGPWQYDFEDGEWTQNQSRFQETRSEGRPSTLTVVTYNILFDYYDTDKLYSGDRHRELCRALRDEEADVICLQEVTPDFLDRLLALPWVQQQYDISDADGHSVRHHGQVILTQLRLRKVHFVNIGNRKRLVVGLVDLMNGSTAAIGCVHLKASEGYEKSRIEQLDHCFAEVNEFAKKNNADTQCLVGDFNFGDGQVENIALRTGDKGSWLDVWPALHWCDTCVDSLGPSYVHDVLSSLDSQVQKYDSRACTALLLRDSELLSAYVAATGSRGPPETDCMECNPGYTVDPVRNDLVANMFPDCPQLRLDRMLIQKGKGLQPRGAGLIGTSMLFHGRHWPIWPSDHFGLVFELDVVST